MLSITATRNVVGIIGNVISCFLFLSPMPSFWKMFKAKGTMDFHPYPYLAALMNCMLWVFYGMPFVHPDSLLVQTINGFGILMEIIYLTFFLIYTIPKYKRIIILGVLAELALLAVIVVPNILANHGTKKRTRVVGIICVLFNLVMYGSPLSNLRTVYQKKSSECMPVWLCLVGFLNGVCWFSYGFLKTFDINLVFGNGLGAIFGLVQLLVWFYYRNGKKEEADVKKPSNVQLTAV